MIDKVFFEFVAPVIAAAHIIHVNKLVVFP